MYKKIDRKAVRIKKHSRLRNKIFGTLEKPRLNVFRSNNHIYAQIIDDQEGKTHVSVSTLDRQLSSDLKKGANKEAAERIGQALAERAVSKGIKKVVFDRGGYIYHGRVKALAEGARKGGLEF